MPLEDLSGLKYINSLNENWPLGSDSKDAGDDHLRGIKNILKRTFPNLTGPVTLSQVNLNLGVLPLGTRTVFYMAAPPVGWQRVTGITNTKALRVVRTVDAGGGSGGTNDPILNDKVASHTHTVSATSGQPSADHAHTISLTSSVEDAGHIHGGYTDVTSVAHYHAGVMVYGGGGAGLAGGGDWNMTLGNSNWNDVVHNHTFQTGGASQTHRHIVTGATGGVSVGHTHTISATAAANTGAANWVPRYLDVILCERVNT